MLLTITAAYAHTIDNVSLFCFVAKPPSLVGARRARSPVDDIQLAVLPAAVPHPRLGYVQRQQVGRRHTEREAGNEGHLTAFSCTTRQCTCTHPSCRLLDQCQLHAIHSFSEASIHLLQIYLQLNTIIAERTTSRSAERHRRQKFELTCCQQY